MAATVEAPARSDLIGEAPPSPAGPISQDEFEHLPLAPQVDDPNFLQRLQFNQRQIEYVFRNRRRYGETFRGFTVFDDIQTFTSHPDHVKSMLSAKPHLVPSLTEESPLRPIVGPNSVLTAQGERHMRQRKLLLPPFHGEAIERYSQMIRDAAEREISSWRDGETIVLADRMQAVTLDVIMAGIFGIEGEPAEGTPEYRLRAAIRQLTKLSTSWLAQVSEIVNMGKTEPVGGMKIAIGALDGFTYPVIEARRTAEDLDERRDIMSLLMQARTEDGEALTDRELRDELLTLVLAGHETTANSLAWAWERLVRTPAAYERLVETVRASGGDRSSAEAREAGAQDESTPSDEVIEQTIWEAMRSRPVIPVIGRRVQEPWRFGEFSAPAGSPVAMSILLVHHREDVYPRPFEFLPERWVGHKPGTYTWLPFGGGTRRCLGAALAMAEMRVVMRTIAESVDLEADTPEPEHAQHRNVTMIPEHGARVVVRGR